MFNFSRVCVAIGLEDSCSLSVPIKARWSTETDKFIPITLSESILFELSKLKVSDSERLIVTKNELMALHDVDVNLSQPQLKMTLSTLSDLGYDDILAYMNSPVGVQYEDGSVFDLTAITLDTSELVTFKLFQTELFKDMWGSLSRKFAPLEPYVKNTLAVKELQAIDLYVKAEHNVWRNNHGEVYSIRYESIRLADTEFKLLVSTSFYDKDEIVHSYVRNIVVQPDEVFVPLGWLREGLEPMDVFERFQTLILTDCGTLCTSSENYRHP